MKKIFFAAVLFFSLVVKSKAQDWITFSSDEGKFSVMFPTQPSVQQDSSTTYPNYTTKLFISRSQNDIFVIGWVDYEASYNFDTQSELEANRDNFIKGIKGTLVSTKNIEFNGYKGLEFSAKSDGAFWTSKVFIVGRRPYQLLAGSTTGQMSENENKFYNSFSITK